MVEKIIRKKRKKEHPVISSQSNYKLPVRPMMVEDMIRKKRKKQHPLISSLQKGKKQHQQLQV